MDFEINGQSYRAAKMNGFQQLHVSRRLAPILGPAVTALQVASSAGSNPDFAVMLQPITEALAHMSDQDCDYIIHACLGVVTRQQGNSWSRVMAKGNSLMFDDLDMGAILQITARVIQEDLGPFLQEIAALLNTSETPPAE